MNRLGVLLTLLAAALPASAWAQNASTPGVLELYPTFESVGARLAYTGDANANATAHLEYRKVGDASWTTGVAMTRLTSSTPSRWAGSMLWLTPNTQYEARVVIADADGGATSATGAVKTRVEMPLLPTGRTWWVAPNGVDTNAGTTGAPLLTIARAMTLVQPGDEIRVRAGVYYEAVTTAKDGSATLPIHLTADGPGVILEGGDPALLHRTDWRDDGGGLFSIAYAPTANRLVCADSLMRLYKETSLANLQSNAHGLGQGFAIEGGRLHVKLEDGTSPNGHTMYISRYNVAITLGSSYWHISGFTIRHYGIAAGGSGVQIWGSNNWIADNFISTLGGRGVFLRLEGSNNLVERNVVFDPRVGGWPWSATKAHDEENPSISNRGKRGNVIRNNTVKGGFDGLDANDGQASEDTAADADYYGNTVSGCGDDGIETDTVSGINLRFWDNTYIGNYSCISLGPIYQGPEYILYNVFVDYSRNAFKFALTSTGVAWICHNTITSINPGTTPIWPTGAYSNATFRNNILIGNGLGACNDDSGESGSGCSFDGDLLWSTGGTTTLFRWKNTNYTTIASLRSATGFESAGKSGDPLFASSSTGDYALRAGSPAIDTGVLLQGITRPFSGAAPDAGAREFGSTVDTIPPGQIIDLR